MAVAGLLSFSPCTAATWHDPHSEKKSFWSKFGSSSSSHVSADVALMGNFRRRNFSSANEKKYCSPKSVLSEKLPGLSESLQYKKLGDSDLLVSEVTLGTMTWGNQNTEGEAHLQLSFAFDNGVNMLDTAEMYPVPPRKEHQGQTDRFISSWLKSQKRDKVILATKVSGYSQTQTWLREDSQPTRVDRKNIEESVDKSLKRLGVDCIDLLQIHWPDRYVPMFGEFFYDEKKERESISFKEQLEAMQSVISKGKVRFIGVSNETSYGVTKFSEAARQFGLPKIVSIQNSYSLLVRLKVEVDLVEVLSPSNTNVALLAYSPLGGGALTGKYLDPNSEEAKKGRFNIFGNFMERYNKSLSREAVVLYVETAKKFGLTPTQLAQCFVRDRPFVTSNIIGATNLDQLKESLSAYALPRPLSREIESEIDKVFIKYRDPAMFN